MYFQCDPQTDPNDWDDDAIFDHIQRVLGEDGDVVVQRGRITEKTVLPFRSFVCDPLSHGRLALAGDAGHTVPPTGAKGLNLAFADVRALVPRLVETLEALSADSGTPSGTTPEPLQRYSRTALDRVWKAQHFSYWATQLLHREPEENPFTHRRRHGEFRSITGSAQGKAYFADGYTGWAQ
jgi:p-hydroxybenzoate 3-monooxygenase